MNKRGGMAAGRWEELGHAREGPHLLGLHCRAAALRTHLPCSPPSCPPFPAAAGVTVAFCFYLSVSVTGYSALGDNVPTLILSGYTGAPRAGSSRQQAAASQPGSRPCCHRRQWPAAGLLL